MTPYFITGSGTGVGKTLFTSALTYQLCKAGKTVRAIKPVISGFEAANVAASDTGALLDALGLETSQETIEAISPWRFTAPLSPDMAAEDENRSIDFGELVAFCKQPANTDYLLVEGVGGIMAPLDVQHTVLDLAAALNFPVILVTGSTLGTLSHTLSAAHAILSRHLPLHAVAICESENSTVPLARTQASLRRFLPKATRLGSIARLDSCDKLWKYVPDLITAFIP